MTEQHSDRPNPGQSPRFLPLLMLLFVGSGCAALIYEVVWFQLLQLVIGSSAVSLGVLLGTFMGGMCAGSLALARIIPAQRHPLQVYALLELGIGVFGVVVLWVVPAVSRLYAVGAEHGLWGNMLRGAVCAVCLLPPTILMGATLPAISRWIEATQRGVSWLGFFYGGNICGAVFGCLLAGFYLLRVYDMATATYVAAALNGTVAVVGFCLAARTRQHAPAGEAVAGFGSNARDSWPILVTIALSGLCALSAEVLWTRLLSLVLGPTVYTFSIILAVFLIGLGIGSAAGSLLARGPFQPRIVLGCCQMLAVAAIAWTAWMIAKSLPYWPVNPSLSRSPWFNFQLDLVRCLWAILPAAILWGGSFPLALAAVASRGQDPGRLVGKVYSANTVGAIIGAVGTGIFLIGWLGTQRCQQLLIGFSALAAVFVFAPFGRLGRAAGSGSGGAGLSLRMTNTAVVLTIGLAVVLAWSVPKIPWQLVAHGRYLPTYTEDRQILYVGEGMNASVAVTEMSTGVRNFHVSGKVEASSEQQDMRLQRMLGHIPTLLHPNPRSVLVVGCGAGVTAGSFVVDSRIERIVICEIEPLIPRVVAQYFSKENYDVLKDPRVNVVYDDARHYVLTTKEKFDIITSDPIHPWVKGAATLYTKEYFEMCRQHLNPHGLVTQWVPLYESNSGVVKSEFATFFDVFPNGTVWSNDLEGEGYDVVLLAQQGGELKIDVDELDRRIQGNARLAQSLKDVGFGSVFNLLATYSGRAADLVPWLKNAEINRDRNLRLQYLAGEGLNLYQGAMIYNDMLAYRKFPEELFEGSDQHKRMVRLLLERSKSNE